MTELEKIKYAKEFVDKLADGINPLDGTPVPETDLLSNVRITRCMFYLSDILRQVIDNNGFENKSVTTPFYLTDEQRNSLKPLDRPVGITDFCAHINSFADLSKCKKIKMTDITQWLVDVGMLYVDIEPNGKKRKRVTPSGENIGLYELITEGEYGRGIKIMYKPEAQQFIYDNLDAILDSEKKPLD